METDRARDRQTGTKPARHGNRQRAIKLARDTDRGTTSETWRQTAIKPARDTDRQGHNQRDMETDREPAGQTRRGVTIKDRQQDV